VKFSARSALTRVHSFISESSGGLTLFSFLQKCKLSTGVVQGVHRPSKVSEFVNLSEIVKGLLLQGVRRVEGLQLFEVIEGFTTRSAWGSLL
jgi:hypothetical protein